MNVFGNSPMITIAAVSIGFSGAFFVSGNDGYAAVAQKPAKPLEAPYAPIKRAFNQRGYKYFEKTKHYASKHGVDPSILAIQQGAESMYKPGVCSRDKKGNPIACGLTQFVPDTAKKYGVRYGASDAAIDSQINGQAKYMASLLRRYKGDYVLAVFAYNQGEGNADRYLRGVRFKTTHGREYVRRILGVKMPVDGSKYRRAM